MVGSLIHEWKCYSFIGRSIIFMDWRMATFLERIHLEIIQAVDRHGSLTAAAERLHLTQPALSHCIRKLEDQLNTPKIGRAHV